MIDAYGIAQIIGFICFIAGLWRLQLKEHRSIILCDIPICSLWTIHYMLLGGVSGFVINGLSVLRAIARCYLSKRNALIVIILIMTSIWALCLYYYTNIYSLAPPLASTIVTYGMLKDCRRFLTNCILIHNALWIIYGISLLSPLSCLSPAAGIVSCIIGKIRHEKRRDTDIVQEPIIIKSPA